MFRLIFLLFLLPFAARGVEYHSLMRYLQPHPFNYDMGFLTFEGKTPDADVMICCHGLGGDEKIANYLNSYECIDDHLIGFRFPDHGNYAFLRSPQNLSYGTVREFLPFLYLLKRIVIDAEAEKINLYGYSAGGGCIVNTLAILIENRFSEEIEAIGIKNEERQKILSAIQKGLLILECPLKSLDEVCAQRRFIAPLEYIKERCIQNDLRPIDSLEKLSPLNLNVLLYFENPDEVLSNRDDSLFIERLSQANTEGKTQVLVNYAGGHCAYHPLLWNTYSEILLDWGLKK